MRSLAPLLILLLSPSRAVPDTSPPDRDGSIAAADTLWERRAEGHRDGQAAAEPIARAIEAYERLLEADPENLAVRWRLLRALAFKGQHVLRDREEKLALYERGRGLADEGRALLHARVGLAEKEDDPVTVASALRSEPDAVEIYFQSTVQWGLWGRTTGKMKAARQGVGSRIRDFATVVALLDEGFESAGGLRILGRLHTEAPKIPFITGWVDHDRAVRDLDRACLLAPDDPDNQRFLADALLRFEPKRGAEALERLSILVARPPRPTSVIEDLAAISEARALLEEHREG